MYQCSKDGVSFLTDDSKAVADYRKRGYEVVKTDKAQPKKKKVVKK